MNNGSGYPLPLFICFRLFVLVRDERQGLLYKVIALAQLVDRVMDEICGDVVERVSQIVELLGMMTVMVEHVLKKGEGFFR